MTTPPLTSGSLQRQILKTAAFFGLAAVVFVGSLLLLWLSQTPLADSIKGGLSSLFAMDSVQSWWYVTRAAGLTAYLLMWLSMVWGLAITSKIFHPTVDGSYSYDFHEFLSLLGIGFVILHVAVLMLDKYLPFNLLQILIPFVDTYRPLWVGFGIIGFYILLLVTVTFYLRRSIGTGAFRSIHVLSLLGCLGTTLHGLFAGTDSALGVTKLLYIGTGLSVVFLTVYWLVMVALTKREQRLAAAQAMAAKRRAQRLRPAQRWTVGQGRPISGQGSRSR
jgi:predicted ferric reductase